jgi:hypothetical protein
MPDGNKSASIVALVRKSGTTFGFKSAERRRVAWRLVLGCDVSAVDEANEEQLPPQTIDRQIVLDVDRSFHFDVCRGWSENERTQQRLHLSAVLHRVFSHAHEDDSQGSHRLHYYQGANDVASVCLIECGSTLAISMLQKLYNGPLRGYTESTMAFPMVLVDVMSAILHACEPEVAAKLDFLDIPMHFAFSWVLTWFAHNLESLENVSRVFDFLICSPPILATYLAVALVCCNKELILETEDDYGELYMLLQSLPTKLELEPHASESPVTLAHLLIVAQAIFETHPLPSLDLPGSCMLTVLRYWPELQPISDARSKAHPPTINVALAAGVTLLAVVVGLVVLWPKGTLNQLLAVLPSIPSAICRLVGPFWKSAWWLAPGPK